MYCKNLNAGVSGYIGKGGVGGRFMQEDCPLSVFAAELDAIRTAKALSREVQDSEGCCSPLGKDCR
jgi:hypothetical protein